ncbi:MAG: hypothetical protein Q8N10_11580 [Phenylobacterium sp.]|uniref:Secreted protein n=1 Tax=Phenylobacterium ferrooxidans TaxID=2982689 RepID=A0ABW6CTT8_9CAUL|nr:hypothetical protein [Phenylobacterium sp.]MDO8912545.1 hypothetical protein [Phenylobacterium sp.]MDP3101128.1 hypothetical protein [Phenylobacterium sp.]HQT55598.1 hypothetical protein [Phenylobacterium sp.]
MILVLLMAAALGAADDKEPASAPQAPAVVERVPVAAPLKKGEKRIKMICRTETTTGTRFTKRVCYDKAELEARQEREREQFIESQNSQQINH